VSLLPASMMLPFFLALLLWVPVAGAAKACPHLCICYESSDFVDCRGRHLAHIPRSIPHSTWLLDLRHNSLTSLEAGSFDTLWSMKILLLAHNSVGQLWPKAFTCLGFLEKIDLSHNLLAQLPPDFSDELASLKELKAAYNRLSAVGYESLQHLESLEKLDLSYNQVASIEKGAFRGLSRLRYLYLHTHLQLAGNPWACDCDLQRVFSKILSVRHLHVEDYTNITCASPWQLAGLPLVSVDTQLCVAETATVLVITVTVLVTVIAAIVMAERNRKKSQEKNWNESDGPLDPQEK
uniref:LRRNT domain-containing protein n=1 Tax=Gopherus evgoodei TaxID=1825980 RepID=A0A8C4WRF2_9SAUR